jgi:hypothetical protein
MSVVKVSNWSAPACSLRHPSGFPERSAIHWGDTAKLRMPSLNLYGGGFRPSEGHDRLFVIFPSS